MMISFDLSNRGITRFDLCLVKTTQRPSELEKTRINNDFVALGVNKNVPRFSFFLD